MFQIMQLEHPIPSCELHGLKWNGESHMGGGGSPSPWTYLYAVSTPFEITDDNDRDLIIYEHIMNLNVKIGDGQHPEAVNIHFKTLSQYMMLLECQRQADLAFRARYRERHPEAVIADFSKKELENRDWSHRELKKIGVHFLSDVLEVQEGVTTFVVA